MIDVYVVTMRSKLGAVRSVPFIGDDKKHVLWTALELYPDWQIVRVSRDQQWDES